jgi:hypothetical protein
MCVLILLLEAIHVVLDRKKKKTPCESHTSHHCLLRYICTRRTLKGAEVQQSCNRAATEVQQSYLNDAEALLEVEAPRVREQPRRLYVYICIHIYTCK